MMRRVAMAIMLLVLSSVLSSGCGLCGGLQPPSTPATNSDTPTAPPVPTDSVKPSPTGFAGDIGWRKIRGTIYGPSSGIPLSGVLVECSQFSYVPREGSCAPYEITTGPDGSFEFDVFVHDTDSITISAQMPGFEPAEQRLTGLDCLAACPLVELELEMYLT